MTGTRLFTCYVQTRSTVKDTFNYDDTKPPIIVAADGESQAIAAATQKFDVLAGIADGTARVAATTVNIVFPA